MFFLICCHIYNVTIWDVGFLLLLLEGCKASHKWSKTFFLTSDTSLSLFADAWSRLAHFHWENLKQSDVRSFVLHRHPKQHMNFLVNKPNFPSLTSTEIWTPLCSWPLLCNKLLTACQVTSGSVTVFIHKDNIMLVTLSYGLLLMQYKLYLALARLHCQQRLLK